MALRNKGKGGKLRKTNRKHHSRKSNKRGGKRQTKHNNRTRRIKKGALKYNAKGGSSVCGSKNCFLGSDNQSVLLHAGDAEQQLKKSIDSMFA